MSIPVVEYEMGYRTEEFNRVLCGPFSGDKSDYRCEAVDSNRWRISQVGESLVFDISISEMPPRKLGPIIEVPVLLVRFYLNHANDRLQARFFERFHQYFHKGGG